jgi:hypothetical protein
VIESLYMLISKNEGIPKGLGGILTLNPPHSPFFKGGGFARGVVACGNNVVKYSKSIPLLKKEGASSYVCSNSRKVHTSCVFPRVEPVEQQAIHQ